MYCWLKLKSTYWFILEKCIKSILLIFIKKSFHFGVNSQAYQLVTNNAFPFFGAWDLAYLFVEWYWWKNKSQCHFFVFDYWTTFFQENIEFRLIVPEIFVTSMTQPISLSKKYKILEFIVFYLFQQFHQLA